MISCTDLEIENNVDVLVEDFFQSEEDYVRFISPIYTNLSSFMQGGSSLLGLQEISSDEICVPVRGSEWNDGGIWKRLHRHQWKANEDYLNITWNFLYQGVHECNRVISALEDLHLDTADGYISETKAMRAIYYLWLIDLFGNVPIITSFNQPGMPGTSPRLDVFSFIETELITAREGLKKEVTSATYGRVNYFVAEAALATLYLNAEVYIGNPHWEQVIQHCNEIIESGLFQLETDYFSNFSTHNSQSSEIIFAIPYDETNITGMNISMATLHPASQQTFILASQPWNGWCTLADFFVNYDINDKRKGDGLGTGSFLFGQQYTIDGDTLFEDSTEFYEIDPDGLVLNYTPQIRNLDSAYAQDGARINKFEIALGSTSEMENDFPIFRYGRILMMKSEALWRLGQAQEALALFNQVRQRAGLPEFDQLTEEIWLAELGREFFMEAHRRTDLIRFGKFRDSWWEKPDSEPCKSLFPIPLSQLQAGSNLNQNPCY